MDRSIPVARLAALTEAAATLVSATDLESVLRRMVETACAATGAKYAALGVIGAHKTLIEFVHTGIDKATVGMIGHLPEGRGVLGTLIREGNTIRLERIQDHPDSVGFPPGHPHMETFLGVPVGRGKAFGNLYLTEKEGGFSEDDELIVEALASIAAAAVETTRLRERLEDMAVVEDRQRIGRDLHDSIIQDLFGTGLHLQGLAAGADDDALRTGLEDAVERIDETIESLRGIVAGLDRPGSGGSFAEELRTRLAGLARPYQVDLAVVVAPPDMDLAPDVVDLVIPMVTEAASNALRHSGSDVIDVRVELLRDRIIISVIDQGTGFDPAQVVSGMGLRNLRERAAGVGGDTEITSVPGVGTVIEVVLPYSEG